MFPSMTISPHEKLFRLFLYTIFIIIISSSSSSSRSSSSSNSNSINAVIFVAAVSIITNVIIFKYLITIGLFLYIYCSRVLTL
jgi:hypothetical protein